MDITEQPGSSLPGQSGADRPSVQNPDSVLSPQSSSLSFGIPQSDLARFARLSDQVRRETTRLLNHLRQIHGSPNKSAAIAAIAAQYKGVRGYSAESIARKYYSYVASEGDWTVVLDRAKAGPAFWNADAQVGLPADFIEFWKSLCERNQRKIAPAWRDLTRIWKTGRDIAGNVYKKIPGYPDWNLKSSVLSPQSSPLPSGWSQANLTRHASDAFELAIARQGREAAAQFSRKVFTTRAGLRVGQFYLFDDQEYDTKVTFVSPSGRLTPGARPVGLNVLDLHSACCVAWGMKPVLIDDEGVKKKGLERYMPFLVAHVLCNLGYCGVQRHAGAARAGQPFEGTTLVIESGSATLRDPFIERLITATQGSVIVHKGQTSNTPGHPGQFEGPSKGNPRFKAHIESFFNLVRNEMASLPSATGLDRDHAPAELYGRDQYHNRLVKAAARLSPERAALLKSPHLTYAQFLDIARDVYSAINNRTDHDLEGWEKSGHVLKEMFVDLGSGAAPLSDNAWNSFSPEERAILQSRIQSRARKLSPQEVWQGGATALQKLGMEMLPHLLGPDLGEERRVVHGYITVEDKDLDTEPFRFPCAAGEGAKFLCYQNPFNPDVLVLANAQGAYVGQLNQQDIPRRDDVAAVQAQIKYAAAEEAKRIAPVAARAMPLAEAKRDLHNHNRAVLNGQPVTAEEIDAAAQLRERLKKNHAIADLLKPEAEASGDDVGCNDPLLLPKKSILSELAQD
ncbi:MAG TPA: hypothetical protein VM680_18485 [Verrucomicrobiae bacterium]|nr:hypothetical protein [Verrucomicrobiae bacterium]